MNMGILNNMIVLNYIGDINIFNCRVDNMFLMNSSQQNDKASKAYNQKIIKDIFKISLIVIALKVGTALINKN